MNTVTFQIRIAEDNKTWEERPVVSVERYTDHPRTRASSQAKEILGALSLVLEVRYAIDGSLQGYYVRQDQEILQSAIAAL